MRSLLLLLVVFALPVFPLLAQEAFTPEEQAAMEERLEVMRQRAPGIHISVYPIVVNEYAEANTASGAALLFENAGVNKIDVNESSFLPPLEAGLVETTRGFQAYVKQHPFLGDYACLIKFTGDQRSGGEEFFYIVLDREANPVYCGSHTRTLFKPKTILGCVNESVKMICETVGLGDTSDTSGPGGEWRQYFEEQKARRK